MGQYKGGYVKEPEIGIHKNVIILDFRSLFPSIIVTHNISPETLNCNHKMCKKRNKVPEINRWFCIKNEGRIPERIRKMIKDREEIKKQLKSKKVSKKEISKLENKEKQLKLATNIQYGLFSFKNSDHYCVKCGEAASIFGRFYLKKTMKSAEKSGFKVIYADTDGLYLTKASIKKGKDFVKKFNKTLPGVIELEFRGIYKKGLFVSRKGGKGAKKKYALIDNKGNMLIRGFETRREDWCKLSKDTQEKILKYILEDKKDEAVSYVKSVIKKLKKRKVNYNDLIINVQLAKPLSTYKVTGPHIAVAKKIKSKQGDIISFVITKDGEKISDRAKFFKDSNIKEIDVDYYIANQIIPSALRVLSIFKVSEQDLLGKTLKGFLKK